LNKVPTAA